ncbi:MAG: hypothetical protein NTY29_03920 [Proteobacteria bacterium]|nr:hypothetical protein [Pseudomonadota bacterium]
MKKMALLVLFAFVLSVGAPLAVQAVSEGEFCNPKKLGECQTKIDNLIASLDAFKAKLVNTRQSYRITRCIQSQAGEYQGRTEGRQENHESGSRPDDEKDG